MLRTVLVYFLALVIGLLALGFYIRTSETAPSNAIVLVDDEAGYYIAPPCARDQGSLRVATISEVHRRGYKPDKGCVNEGGFMGESHSLTMEILENIGLVKPSLGRWNADGTWNY
jgi:hypothetical protein